MGYFCCAALVPFIRLNFQMREFASEENPWLSKIIAEAKALDSIKDEAKRLINLMEEFFGWLENPPSSRTKQTYIEALLAYSKYVYRSETDKTMALNFEDIPITNRLKFFTKKLRTKKTILIPAKNIFLGRRFLKCWKTSVLRLV